MEGSLIYEPSFFFEEFFMKYLVSCLLALPLITSCVEQDQYYERHYYSPAPRVEVQRDYNNHHRHQNEYYRPAPQGRIYHGHDEVRHNVHRHDDVRHNVHGHDGNNDNIAVHPHASEAPHGAQEKVHGHNGNGKPQQPIHNNHEAQDSTHGHN